jgi:hypothetical protein
MKNNETGEFELVVGNRQLLSGFFIVILLLAVTFAMGYVVGQNSPRTAKVQAEVPASTVVPSDIRQQPVPVAPPSVPAASATDSGKEEPPQDVAQPGTQPAREPAAVSPAVAPSTPAASAPAAVQTETPPGSYWQVMAVNQPAAEAVVKTLRDKGFPVVMTPGPNNLVRVLVGPYSDVQTMSKAKTELENFGLRPVRK